MLTYTAACKPGFFASFSYLDIVRLLANVNIAPTRPSCYEFNFF